MGKKINETMKKMIETIQHDWKQPWGNVLSIMKRDTLGDAEDLCNAMTVLIDKGEWLCPICEEHGDDAYYSISKDKIVVPEANQFACADDFYGEVLHNMAHSTGAESCLNRLKPCNFGSAQYSHEELVAELSAVCIMQMFGLDKRCKEDSLPYIKSWLDQMEEDDKWMDSVLKDVDEVVDFITKGIKNAIDIEKCTMSSMGNNLTSHEREALNLLDEYADNSKETAYGTIKWIELNDTKARISWGRVVCIKLNWWTDGTGWHCTFDCIDDNGNAYDCELLRDQSDEDQQALVNIICDWTADMQVYRPNDIRQVLADMAEYALGCEEQELQYYFEQMTETGLFHDAIGKVVKREEGKVIVSTSY